jgi:hypothetical protein
MTGGKGRTIGRDHHPAHALVVADLVQRSMQFGDQAFGQAVASIRPVEREHGDTADLFAEQDLMLRGSGTGSLGGHRSIRSGAGVVILAH